MGKYFGRDGFLGKANVSLTVMQAFQIGRYLGWYYGRDHHPKVAIGKDTRRSSYMIEDALSAGLTASGADVYLLHVMTTPGVAYIIRSEEFDCGIMISASHNPYPYNGIRILNRSGEMLEDEVIRELERYMDRALPDPPLATGRDIGCTTDYISGRNRYIGYLIMLSSMSFRGCKIALDCANGSAFQVAGRVFEALGARPHLLHADPDGTNINDRCGSTDVTSLREYVLAHHLDAGFAYDGDADRCIAVDETGGIIDGDRILYICGKYMKEKGQLAGDTITTTVMANRGLAESLGEAGISCRKTAVGDRYVYDAMRDSGCRLGGEQCGHIIFSKYASTGDGILTSLKLMEIMLDKKKSLHQLTEDFHTYPQLCRNIPVKDKMEAWNDPDVQAEVQAVSHDLGDAGRVLVRSSHNEPLIRVMVEAASDETCRVMTDRIADVLRENGHITEGEYDE